MFRLLLLITITLLDVLKMMVIFAQVDDIAKNRGFKFSDTIKIVIAFSIAELWLILFWGWY